MNTERMQILRKAIKRVGYVDDNVYDVLSRLGEMYEQTEFDGLPFDPDRVTRQKARLYEMVDALDEAIELLDYTLMPEELK